MLSEASLPSKTYVVKKTYLTYMFNYLRFSIWDLRETLCG